MCLLRMLHCPQRMCSGCDHVMWHCIRQQQQQQRRQQPVLGVAYDTFAGLKLLANFRIRIRNWNRSRIRIRIKHEAHIRLPRPSFTPSLGKQRSSSPPSPPLPSHLFPFAPPAKCNVFLCRFIYVFMKTSPIFNHMLHAPSSNASRIMHADK